MEFYKYHGTGNDFIIIDNRTGHFSKNNEFVKQLCDRRFGIGADGLILLENSESADFKMVYYNADGHESSMCGNGGRCLVAFAHFLGLFETKTTFNAVDGLHEAQLRDNVVKLKMIDVGNIEKIDGHFVLNTGSPHFVTHVEELEDFDVYKNGNKIRNSATYCQEGINVNFSSVISDDTLFVRTYERGVEDETLSCGTGATAAALVFMEEQGKSSVNVKVLGGMLKVYAEQDEKGFHNVWLEGPATQVFRGNY